MRNELINHVVLALNTSIKTTPYALSCKREDIYYLENGKEA